MIYYKDIFEFDIIIMKEIIEKYGTGLKSWELFNGFYKDPDGYAVSDHGLLLKSGIECTADGILSVNRIYYHEGFNDKFIDCFAVYRKVPIFFFPKEKGGINTSRFSKFGDRIDHTLYDLKQYYENRDCKLKTSYELPGTQSWLNSFENFADMANWMNIDGIFVDSNYNVYDLENDDGKVISDYYVHYDRAWSECYYNNVKEKIRLFMKNKDLNN